MGGFSKRAGQCARRPVVVCPLCAGVHACGHVPHGRGRQCSDDAAYVDADIAGDPACSESFCRVSLPDRSVAVALDGLWAKNESDAWVVGSGGYAARFDGTEWRRVETGTKATIYAVTGSEDGMVWGASGGTSFLALNGDGGVVTIDAGSAGVSGSRSNRPGPPRAGPCAQAATANNRPRLWPPC